MTCLRTTRLLTRWVLLWFVLALGAAIASPLVKPQAIDWVCSGGGAVKLVVSADDDATATVHPTLDCPLCMTPAAPPPPLRTLVPSAAPLAHALPPRVAEHIAGRTAAPLPARGPPSLS